MNALQPVPDQLTELDLAEFGHLLPKTAQELMRTIGAGPALALMNRWPGVRVKVPQFADANPAGARRWAQLLDIVGQPAMDQLAAALGGHELDIPTTSEARQEKRYRAIRKAFDLLTARPPGGHGLSRADALQEIGLMYGPMSNRHIRRIVDRPNAAPAATCPVSL